MIQTALSKDLQDAVDFHRAQGQVFWRLCHGPVSHVGRGMDVGMVLELGQQCGLQRRVDQGYVCNEHGQQLRFSGIKAALEHLQAGNSGHVDPQGLRAQAGQRVNGVRQWRAVCIGFGGGVRRTAGHNG